MNWRVLAGLGLVGVAGVAVSQSVRVKPWWTREVDRSLARAGSHKSAWVKALAKAEPGYRSSWAYLVQYMPTADLLSLDPNRVGRNIRLAHAARAAVPWGRGLPDSVFLDAVLPYANVTEPRDSMRAEFMARYLPIAKRCHTPGEAAQLLNSKLFKDYKVSYNTRRLRTDQNPRETISQGMATCTGLSIMLVDACRAVGIPARIAGISSWPGRGGNHTWVEVYDQGWHFVGAAEPDANGLDHAWFSGDAAKAIENVPESAIYAVTYRQTGQYWPIVWDPGTSINAENVTRRYQGAKGSLPRFMVELTDKGQRVEAPLQIFDSATGDSVLKGNSYGPTVDVNLNIGLTSQKGRTYIIVAETTNGTIMASGTMGPADTVLRIDTRATHRDDVLRKVLKLAPTAQRQILASVPMESWAAKVLRSEGVRFDPKAPNIASSLDAMLRAG